MQQSEDNPVLLIKYQQEKAKEVLMLFSNIYAAFHKFRTISIWLKGSRTTIQKEMLEENDNEFRRR